jgi:hypothetical protein
MKFSGMNHIGGKIILWGLILAMLVFTAIRTLHFLQLTFPPDQQYVAYLALAAFDVGILGWFYYATQSAEGVYQRVIAYGMIFICMAGVCLTTIADMILVSSENGLTKLPPQWGTIGVWGVIIVIILNVVSGILVHLADPVHLQHMAKESAKDKIHALVVTEIHNRAQEIAPQVAQQAAQYWVNQTVHEFLGHIPGAKQPAQLPQPQTTVQPVSMAQSGTFIPPQKHLTQQEQQEQYNTMLRALVRNEQQRLHSDWLIDEEDKPQVEKLLRQAVARGQATEDEVRPLLAALRVQGNSQSNGNGSK